MYKWKIEIILNCGKEIVGRYDCDHKGSFDAAQELLTGNVYDYFAIASLDKSKQIAVKLGDVSYMAISVLEEQHD